MQRKIIKAILHFVAIVVYRVKKTGEENIPAEGGYILCGNHINALDAPTMVIAAKRKIRFVAKDEINNNKLLKWLAKIFEIITIKRGTADIDATKKILRALKDGDIVGIFPEGTRNGMKKNIKVKSGAAYFALKTNTPIIPVGIKGSFKPFRKVTYNFGKPMDFSKYEETKSDKETLEKVTKEIFDEIIKLSK